MAYFLLFYINMSLNFDHGTMPSASKDMSITLDLNSKQLGWLGSLVFIGQIGGSIASSYAFKKY